jgi:hypothetical protein
VVVVEPGAVVLGTVAVEGVTVWTGPPVGAGAAAGVLVAATSDTEADVVWLATLPAEDELQAPASAPIRMAPAVQALGPRRLAFSTTSEREPTTLRRSVTGKRFPKHEAPSRGGRPPGAITLCLFPSARVKRPQARRRRRMTRCRISAQPPTTERLRVSG